MGLLHEGIHPDEEYKNINWEPLVWVKRSEWGALPPTSVETFKKYPVKHVVLGYTETEPCTNREECIKLMQDLQQKHMAEGMSDIRYSFVCGGDGAIYEGRGWDNKPGVHYRYSELNGENYDMVHSGQKGQLPDAHLSGRLWLLQDQGIWNGKIEKFTDVLLNYEDPLTDEEHAMRVEEGWKSGV